MTFRFAGRRGFAATAAVALVTLASCAAPSGGPGGTPAPVAWTRASAAADIATWAQQLCRGGPSARIACLDRTLIDLIDPVGVGRAMEVLDTLVVRDGAVRENAHAFAHGLGINAYRSPGTVAATFAECPPSQMSGCYHGVIQGYFLAMARSRERVGGAELDALCDPHRESSFLFFQCAHGMGHGVMAFHDNDLPLALDACDSVADDFVRTSCYAGVFMENIVLVTHPHHTAAGHAGHGAGDAHAAHDEHAGHAGHAAGAPAPPADEHADHADHAGHSEHATTARAPWRPLDRSRPLYPCTEVDARYHEACYTMQSSAMLFFNGGNVSATARSCEGAPGRMVEVCIGSLGRDITALAARDHRRSIDLCQRTAGAAAGRAEGWCLDAVAVNLVNLAADPDEGLRFCRAVEGDANKRSCYRSVGTSIAALESGTAERARRCSGAEAGFIGACREGAGVDARGS